MSSTSLSDSHKTMEEICAAIGRASHKYPRVTTQHIGYGTAGFRTKAGILDHVMFRVGVIASLRSKVTYSVTGVMITASHNPEADNGAKIVDPKGEMLDPYWEKLATNLANVDDSMVEMTVLAIMKEIKLDLTLKGVVFIGQDSRPSSPRLSKAVIEGIMSVEGSKVEDFGLVTTPIIHYLVFCKNDGGRYGKPTVDGYYEKLSKAFKILMGKSPAKGNYIPELIIDGSNGVGAVIGKRLFDNLVGSIEVTMINEGGVLNQDCGADYVKVNQREPLGLSPRVGARYVSIDGDADRLIYFYFDDKKIFRMLDGDKIAILFADHLSNLVHAAEIKLKIGLVQTAYANGSSTNYARNTLNIPVKCTPTGVKHLHHAALDYDIGVYFEANGHGTVVFSKSAVTKIKQTAEEDSNEAAVELKALMDVMNSTVGDALSDILAVEAILHSKGWNIVQWDQMYQDLPNRQLKVQIDDRNVVKTEDAERRVVDPKGLQNRINELVAKHNNGRAFVRPSGTEDIVRVYAEADTQTHADILAREVAGAVHKFCCTDPVDPDPEGQKAESKVENVPTS